MARSPSVGRFAATGRVPGRACFKRVAMMGGSFESALEQLYDS